MINVERFRAGERAYIEEVVRQHSSLVLLVCQAYAPDYDHAQDLFQDTWKTVLGQLDSFSGRGSFRSWLYQVATNVCLSDLRAGRATTDKLEVYSRDRSAPRGWGGVDPLAETERRELHHAIHQALPLLSDGQRDVVLMRVMEGRAAKEVAALMGISQATVRSHLRHALNRLRTIMEDPDNELSRHRATS